MVLFITSTSASVDWNSFRVFDGESPPYASNGPGCIKDIMGNNPMATQKQPGQSCPRNDSVYDLGAVWVDMDDDYVAWMIYAPNLTRAGYCGGPMSSTDFGQASTLGISVEFDTDSNFSTGCRMPNMTFNGDNCFPGSEYRFYLFGGNNTVFEIYNRSLGSCSGGFPMCFQTMDQDADPKYRVESQVTCGPFPTIIKIAVNKTALPGISGMTFQTITLGGGPDVEPGPVDMLGGFSGGEFMQGIMMGGPQDMMFMGKHPCLEITNNNSCVGNQTYSCKWNNMMQKCEPNFIAGGFGMTCNEFCGSCNTTATCNTGAKGKCKVVSAPPMLPPEATSWNDSGIKMCVEDPSKYIMGGGSCDNDCKYCYSNSTCSNSAYPSPMGGSGGCKWVTDSYFGKSWCDLSTFNINRFYCSASKLDRCFDSQNCTTAGGNWSAPLKLCYSQNMEICFDGVDNNNNSLMDCRDPMCSKDPFCGGDIDVLTGGFGTLDPVEAMKKQLFSDMDPSPPAILFREPAEYDTIDVLDITELMMKDMGSSIGMGIGVRWLVNQTLGAAPAPLSAICGGSFTGKYYYLVDVDANLSTGCNATIRDANYSGFDYKYEYEVEKNDSGSFVEIKRGYRCLGYDIGFGLYPAKMAGSPTMAEFGDQKISCVEQVAIVAVDKADMGNPRSNMRFMVATSYNDTGLENANDTLLGPNNRGILYTPGTIDFKPTDCFSNPMACGTAFSIIGGGKFMPFEDCFLGSGDEDLDELTNCADPDCLMAPWCATQAGTFNLSSDQTAPTVVSSSVETFMDFVFMHWVTNEPTNTTVTTYLSCSNSTAVNTIYDLGDPAFTFDDYRPWHDRGLKAGEKDSLNADIGFAPGSIYFYKLSVCDKAGNCATSSCLNFTLKSQPEAVQYKFDFVPPPNPMVNTTAFRLWNGTGYELIDPNAENNKSDYLSNATLLFDNPDNGWSIEFEGIDLAKAIDFNLTSAFNVSNLSGSTYVGLGSNDWQEMAQSLGVESVKIKIPETGTSLMKCNENNLSECSDVSAQANLTLTNETGGYTIWEIPISLGFSSYTTGGGTENYSIIFKNISASLITVNISQKAVFTINMTNNDTTGRIYNFTVTSNSSTAQVLINHSSSFVASLGNISDSNKTVQVLVNITDSFAGLVSFYITATPMNDATTHLYSSDDVNLTARFLDNVVPTMSWIYPTINGSYTNNASFSCSMNGTYGYAMNLTLFVYNSTNAEINRTTTAVTGYNAQTAWSLSLADGLYFVSCLGVDVGNNQNMTQPNTTITIDSVRPAIEFGSLVNGNGANISLSQIVANVSLTETNLANVTFTLYSNGGLYNRTTFTTGNRYILWTGLANGTYTYNVSATDYANQFNVTQTRTITLDTGLPNVILDSPANASYSQASVNLTANLSDMNSGVKNASLVVYNSSNALYNETVQEYNPGVTSATIGIVINFVEGVYKWFYKLLDWAGNSYSTASGNRTLTIDTTNPLISLGTNTANDGANYSRTWIYVNISLTETNIANVTFKLYNRTGPVNITTFSSATRSINWTGLSDEIYTYNASVADLTNSNNYSATRTITLDTAVPSATNYLPAPYSYINATTMSANISILTMDNIGTQNVSIFVYYNNGSLYYFYNETNNYLSLTTVGRVIPFIVSGAYNWSAVVTDFAGNKNSTANWTLTIDGLIPAINFTSGTYSNGVNVSSSQIIANVSLTETNLINITYRLFYSNGSLANETVYGTAQTIILWTGLANGTYTYNVTATDFVNQFNSTETRTVVLDTGLPNAILVSPENATYSNTTVQNLTANLTDNLGIKNATIYVYNTSSLYNMTTEEYSTSGTTSTQKGFVINFVEGVYKWFYKLFDWAGNSYTTNENHTLSIDTNAPSLSISLPTNNQNLSIRVITINISANDSISLNYTSINIYNSSNDIVNTTVNTTANNFLVNLTVNNDGVYSVMASSYDKVNNYTTSTISNIRVDTTGPVITVAHPVANGTYYINQTIVISMSALDATTTAGGLRYNANGTTNNSYTGLASVSFVTNGSYRLFFYANDTLGNLATTVFNISISSLPTNTTIANSSTVTVDENTSSIVVPYNTTLQNITVPANLSSLPVTIDLSQMLNNLNVSLQNTTFILTRSAASVNYSVEIPAFTNISGASGWDGKIALPIVNSSAFSAPSSGTVNVVINVGSNVSVNFSNPVKVVIGGVSSNQRAAWSSGSTTLNNIETACTSATDYSNINPITTRECYVISGTDLIIWTYHFTSFAAYTPSTSGVTLAPGNSGPGGSVVSKWVKDIKVNDSDLNRGQTLKALKQKYRITFNVSGMGHSVGITNITVNTVTIEVASTPQTAILSNGETKKFDVNSDGYYDISVYLVSISYPTADLKLTSINEKIATSQNTDATTTAGGNQIPSVTTPTGGLQDANTKAPDTVKMSPSNSSDLTGFWFIVGIFLFAMVCALGLYILLFYNKKKRYK